MSKSGEISNASVENKIYLIREQKIMLDFELAEMYGIETKALKQSVRRNLNRFPEDFMFEMTEEEFSNCRSQNVPSNSLKMGLRYKPFCFTEYGVLMLSSVLRSARAVQVNIQIMRVYSKMKELVQMNKEVLMKLEILEKDSIKHDKEIKLIFDSIRWLIAEPIQRTKRIGFKKDW